MILPVERHRRIKGRDALPLPKYVVESDDRRQALQRGERARRPVARDAMSFRIGFHRTVPSLISRPSFRFNDACALAFRSLHVGSPNEYVVEVCLRKHRTPKRRVLQLCFRQPCASQIGVIEPRAPQVCFRKRCTLQARLRELPPRSCASSSDAPCSFASLRFPPWRRAPSSAAPCSCAR